MANGIKNIVLGVEALAAALDCGRDAAEHVLNDFEFGFKSLTNSERNDLRQKMIFIVVQLSRLEVRLMASDRPIHGSV